MLPDHKNREPYNKYQIECVSSDKSSRQPSQRAKS